MALEERIISQAIETEMKTSYLDYAMSVIVSRALPDVRDRLENFGSVEGDPAGAMRYTEARLSRLAMEMLADIDKETVDFVPNFDESMREPGAPPARTPRLLMNGASGIAVGMATNIPPHNLGGIGA